MKESSFPSIRQPQLFLRERKELMLAIIVEVVVTGRTFTAILHGVYNQSDRGLLRESFIKWFLYLHLFNLSKVIRIKENICVLREVKRDRLETEL